MKFKVINGCNRIGAPSLPNNNPTDNFGARGGERFGSFTSPINGCAPPNREIRLPPSYAERIHDMNVPDYAKITTHKTERNKP